MSQRLATIRRETTETSIDLELNLDGSGRYEVYTGIGFFDHMLELFAKHGFFDLRMKCSGDLHVDPHHTVEDIGISLGQAIAQALGDKSGIVRYGLAYVPMDEALARVVIDLSGRPYLALNFEVCPKKVGEFPIELVPEFFRAVSDNGRMNLHVDLLRGVNGHHCVETIFKAFGKALSQAVLKNERVEGVLSTKGIL